MRVLSVYFSFNQLSPVFLVMKKVHPKGKSKYRVKHFNKIFVLKTRLLLFLLKWFRQKLWNDLSKFYGVRDKCGIVNLYSWIIEMPSILFCVFTNLWMILFFAGISFQIVLQKTFCYNVKYNKPKIYLEHKSDIFWITWQSQLYW